MALNNTAAGGVIAVNSASTKLVDLPELLHDYSDRLLTPHASASTSAARA